MKKLYIGIIVLLYCFTASAQQQQAIRFSERLNTENARRHLTVLSSDAYQGREAGTKGGAMAAGYIRQQFKKMGLSGPVQGSYTQQVDAVTIALSESLKVNSTSFAPIQDFFNMPNSVSLQGFNLKTDSILFAGYGVIDEGLNPYNDYEGQEVEGKVVMIMGSGPRDAAFPFQKKIQYLAFHKAKAVLIAEPVVDQKTPELLNYLHTDQVLLKNSEALTQLQSTTQAMPLIYIGQKVADQLLAGAKTDLASVKRKMKESKKPLTLALKADFSASAAKSTQPLTTQNVLGYIPGSDPKLKDEVLVISAHYDHLGVTPYVAGTDKINNGADDNGSGTTGLMLIADAFMQAVKAGKGPKRSILFIAMTGEEKGLLGSQWYVEHPVFPLGQTIADLNTDMIGRTDTIYKTDNNYLYIIGANRLSKKLDSVVKQANREYTHLKLDERYNARDDSFHLYERSDHYNFAKHGIPVVFFFNGFHLDYHKVSDEIAKIDFPALVKRAKLVYCTAWELANAARRPKVDKSE